MSALSALLSYLACATLTGCIPLPIAGPPRDIADVPDGPFSDAVRAIRGLEGTWSGGLVLRDDSNASLASRRLTVHSAVARDGLHLVTDRMLDGPGGETRATDVTWVDPLEGTFHTAAFAGAQHGTERYRISAFTRADAWNWTLIGEQELPGTNDAQGTRRITLTRGGNRVTWRRDVTDRTGEFRVRVLLTLEKDTT